MTVQTAGCFVTRHHYNELHHVHNLQITLS